MRNNHPRLTREAETIEAMLAVYCAGQHRDKPGLCPECLELRDYALGRLDRCPFRENKPICAKCTGHCYKPAMRERIRVVMRYSGPRMLLRHPLLAVLNLADGFRKAPALPGRSAAVDDLNREG
jgi:hypothetical protein